MIFFRKIFETSEKSERARAHMDSTMCGFQLYNWNDLSGGMREFSKNNI